MYHLTQFGGMIRDKVRMEAFVEAMRRTITPESVVVDIGTGAGIFALIACQLGARHVHAIEPGIWVEMGRQFAAANGFADRITFYRELSTNVTLPERADVILGDIRGQIPLFQQLIPTFQDARERLLKPGGVVIPGRDRLFAALAEVESIYDGQIIRPWVTNPYGLDMSAAVHFVANTTVNQTLEPEHLLTAPQQWAEIDYRADTALSQGRTLEWTLEKAGTAHFIALWFDTELVDGVTYSSAFSENVAPVYGQMLLPLREPLTLEAGDRVRLTIHADHTASDYLLRWKTEAYAPDGSKRRAFVQSTLYAMPLAGLMRRAQTYVPRLNASAETLRFILNAMSEGQPLSAVAERLAAAFPTRYKTFDDALNAVADVSQGYSD
ncbi:MAG: 50S ribosomal protein L11 methyltransferase [bacterium]|nr:50S ribosomal protein L11 methyltransferase [bacterium]